MSSHSRGRRRPRPWWRKIGTAPRERSLGLAIGLIVTLAIGVAVIGAREGVRLLARIRQSGTGGAANSVAHHAILIAGGYDVNAAAPSATAELYDLDTRQFSPAGAMTSPRVNHTATLLMNGEVLIAGGATNDDPVAQGGILRSAELYNPATGKFTATGSMNFERAGHSALPLPNGKVLILGGLANNDDVIAAAELYDPASGTFTTMGKLTDPRVFLTVTPLANSQWLIAGGEVMVFAGPVRDIANLVYDRLNTAELFDPANDGFKCVGGVSFLGAVCKPSMLSRRRWQTATMLRNGRVLLAGGDGDCTNYRGKAELYDQATGSFLVANDMVANRQQHTATLLGDGQVLIAGGLSPCKSVPPPIEAELYDPAPAQPQLYNGVFSASGSLSEPRASHTATLLPSGPDAGDVLITGGSIKGDATAEMYIPSAEAFACVGGVSESPPICNASMTVGRHGHTATLLRAPPSSSAN